MDTTKHYMTVGEVARLVRRSPSTVRRWAVIGDLPAVLFGGRLLIAEDDLASMVRPPGSLHKRVEDDP